MLRNNRAFALVMALIFALSAAAVGCGDSDSDGTGGTGGRTPGTGGTGGDDGGEGGTGGTDVVICGGGLECAPGEFCNENDECECDPDEDKCGTGLICDPHTLRCEEPLPEPAEFGECRVDGLKDEDKGLECFRLPSGAALWLRPCKESSECATGFTYCESNIGFCWYNLCGDEEDTEDQSEFFGECDTQSGKYSKEGTLPEHTGACSYVETSSSPIGLCMPGGTATVGEACRPDYARGDEARTCALGLDCLGYSYIERSCEDGCLDGQRCNDVTGLCEMKSCSKDADCGDGLFCDVNKICRLEGVCVETCNGGSKGEDASFAACTVDPNGKCPATDETRKRDYVVLMCESPCDPFGGEDACAPLGEDGSPRACAPAPSSDEPTAGTCVLLVDEPVPPGGDCSAQATTRNQVCEPGSICVPEGNTAVCVVYCDCEEGFEAGTCKGGGGDQCGDGETCRFRQGLSNYGGRIGLCGK